LRPPIECVRSLASFDFDKFIEDLEAFHRSETHDRVLLGFYAQAGSALAGGRDAVVGDGMLHSDKLGLACTKRIPPFASCT
jgi:hypothetical protein